MDKPSPEEYEQAMNWLLKRKLYYKDEETTLMKEIKGDPLNRLNLKASDIATWIAIYHRDMTPKHETLVEGRRFR